MKLILIRENLRMSKHSIYWVSGVMCKCIWLVAGGLNEYFYGVICKADVWAVQWCMVSGYVWLVVVREGVTRSPVFPMDSSSTMSPNMLIKIYFHETLQICNDFINN